MSTPTPRSQPPSARRQPAPNPFGGDEPGEDSFGEFWRRFFGEPFGGQDGAQPRQGLGSGVLVDPKGLVLTNNHVVENADKITVRLSDDREFDAKVIGRDARTDIAVVQITGGQGNFPVAPLGDSTKLKVGDRPWRVL